MAHVLVPYEALRSRGITYSKVQLWRLERAGQFPKRVSIGAGRHAWVESELDAFIDRKIAERDAKTAA
ncbi:MAG: AlpA family phage regulatory protein [Alphaproteobacteria bacterium]|nr:AlpA family phage regulatory protein [Alphaproteobacteria bacterium]